MRKLLSIAMLCLLTLFSVSCVDKKADSEEVKLVTAAEMKSILELEDVQLVDVRTSSEYEQIHIKDAQNIDFNSPTFDDDVERLDKNKPVVLYCKGGSRSAKCAKKLKAAGFKKIYELEGGLSKWEHSEVLSIEKKS
ncbi:rhodanese-like domain-containing protein [Winogradskyella jejuensis]|uniref:Rhodanese-related sulfurtransferase n=1 Tax=Winogradskyella jejuensis TaxID=1089305 RepID=A0A1M5KDI7_9FLAO|nr:rhodanese-like domain-containing protein [Winogradskyella jejuensis]SHG50761.1 Rhodanese-related sulfurtransferase [Winogradskyella jejuensis]